MVFLIFIPLLALLAIAFIVVPVMRKRRVSNVHETPADQPTQAPLASEPRANSLRPVWLALGLAIVVAIPSIGLYAYLGRPDLVAQSIHGTGQDGSAASAQGGMENAASAVGVEKMIADLKIKTQQTPNDPEAWQTLGWAYMHICRPADAAAAYKRAVSLAPGNGEYLSALTEATVQSGDGKINETAAADFRRVIALTPTDPRARFYLALYKDQQGDHKGAITDWIGMLKSASPDSPWSQEVRVVVEQVAREQGLNISAQLPPSHVALPSASVDASPSAPGLDAAQVAAAQQMSPADRTAMIHTMVDGLADRLKQNPQDADGWLRLLRARIVLGEKSQAAADYRDARKAFSKSPTELATLDNATHAIGISAQ